MRSNLVLIATLGVLSLDLALQAAGLMVGRERLVTAGNGLGFVVCALACKSKSLVRCGVIGLADEWTIDYAGAAGLWEGEATPIRLPMFPYTRAIPREGEV